MLLNEFLKEHRKVEKLEATIAQQRRLRGDDRRSEERMENMVGRSKEQDAKIQSVSDRLK